MSATRYGTVANARDSRTMTLAFISVDFEYYLLKGTLEA